MRYGQASALDLPCADGTFDVVWTQHASMNIEDKQRLYGEMFRVVRPGGRLLLYDIVAGPGGPIHFPVPWAADPAISFLTTAEQVEGGLRAAGRGGVRVWRNLAVGVGFSRFNTGSEAVVAAALPHPFFFDRERGQ